MLPLILILLAQGISAVEFPDLASHISVIWDNMNISSQINADKTVSVDGRVWTLTLCGPFHSKESTVKCSIEYPELSRVHIDGTLQYRAVSNPGKAVGIAGKISQSGSGASCWLFQNPTSDLKHFYEPNSEWRNLDWRFEYKCPSSSSDSAEFPNLGSHISVIWDNVNISSQINADQTVSVNGTLPIFTLCGFNNSRGSSAHCSLKYQRETRFTDVPGREVAPENAIAIAGKISQSGSGDSCWQFSNPMSSGSSMNTPYYLKPTFDWRMEYTCTTLAFDESSTTTPISDSTTTTPISDSNTNTTINGSSNLMIIGGLICFALVFGILVGVKLGRNTKTRGLNNSSITVELRSKV